MKYIFVVLGLLCLAGCSAETSNEQQIDTAISQNDYAQQMFVDKLGRYEMPLPEKYMQYLQIEYDNTFGDNDLMVYYENDNNKFLLCSVLRYVGIAEEQIDPSEILVATEGDITYTYFMALSNEEIASLTNKQDIKNIHAIYDEMNDLLHNFIIKE